MSHKHATGECFQVGEVWQSPRGVLHRVTGHRFNVGGKRKVADMVNQNTGRTSWREWDAVIGWCIDTHKDGTKAGPGVIR